MGGEWGPEFAYPEFTTSDAYFHPHHGWSAREMPCDTLPLPRIRVLLYIGMEIYIQHIIHTYYIYMRTEYPWCHMFNIVINVLTSNALNLPK